MTQNSFTLKTANRACSLLYSYLLTCEKGVWLLPVNVCPDVPFTFCLAKTPFEFVDIDKDTLCIDENECIRRIASEVNKYIGIVYVRTYGYLSDISAFFEKCKILSKRIRIIDDRCLCIPDFDVEVNPLIDMVLYSTGKSKQIDLGGGGISLSKSCFNLSKDLYFDGTDEQYLYKKAYELNSKIKSIPIGWLKISECHISDNVYFDIVNRYRNKRAEYRQMINDIYTNNLPTEIQLPSNYQKWRFNVKVNPLLKQPIINRLFHEGLFASSHYHSANILFDDELFPNSNKLFDEIINLFNDYNYTKAMAMKTCKIINSVLSGGKYDLSITKLTPFNTNAA